MMASSFLHLLRPLPKQIWLDCFPGESEDDRSWSLQCSQLLLANSKSFVNCASFSSNAWMLFRKTLVCYDVRYFVAPSIFWSTSLNYSAGLSETNARHHPTHKTQLDAQDFLQVPLWFEVDKCLLSSQLSCPNWKNGALTHYYFSGGTYSRRSSWLVGAQP